VGDTIMVRSLAPLPRLEEVTLLRRGSREFVTGQGPFPALIPAWLGIFFFCQAGVFAIAAIVVTSIAYQPVMFLGHPLSPDNDWMRFFGPCLFLLVLLDLGIAFLFRRLSERDKRLGVEGGLLPGELISAKLLATKGGNYLQAECRFTSPDGKIVTGRKNADKARRNLKTMPNPGAKLLILYDSDNHWQAL
jgi:hypothetical protein